MEEFLELVKNDRQPRPNRSTLNSGKIVLAGIHGCHIRDNPSLCVYRHPKELDRGKNRRDKRFDARAAIDLKFRMGTNVFMRMLIDIIGYRYRR